MTYKWFFFCVLCCLPACSEDDDQASIIQLQQPDAEPMPNGDAGGFADVGIQTDVALASDAAQSTRIQARFRVIRPDTGGGFSGVRVVGEFGESTTDANGFATIELNSGPYVVELNAPGARIHRVYGVAGDSDFDQVTYLSTEMITGFVFQAAGRQDDQARGILVVGLDLPSLAPAVGSSASIDATHDAPFIVVGGRPTDGQEIVQGAQGFVTFPNVEPGTVDVSADFADRGVCGVFPAEMGSGRVEVTAGEVAIIAFTCRMTEP